MTFFEDMVVGESVVVGRHTFTADGIKALRNSYPETSRNGARS